MLDIIWTEPLTELENAIIYVLEYKTRYYYDFVFQNREGNGLGCSIKGI